MTSQPAPDVRHAHPFDLLDLSLLLLIAPLHPLAFAFVVTQWFARRSATVAQSIVDLLEQAGLPALNENRVARALLPSLAHARPASLPAPVTPLEMPAAAPEAPALHLSKDEDTAPAPLPGPTDLATILQSGFRPTPERLLLGLGPGGQLYTTHIAGLCHVALCGTTGAGKSNLHRLLLAQILALRGRVWLADPHYAPLDIESGEDWQPIANRLDRSPARKPGEIKHMLERMLDELEMRLEQRHAGQPYGPLLFLAFDELPVILASVAGAEAILVDLLRQGRKVKLLTIGASQDFLVKTLGGSGAIRDCYRTAYYVGGDLHGAAALCDMPRREIQEGQLGKGIALLRSTATTPAQLVRVPLVSNQALSMLLGPSRPLQAIVPDPPPPELASGLASDQTSTLLPAAVPPESGRQLEGNTAVASSASGRDMGDSDEVRILALFREGKSIAEIVSQVYNCASSGRRYQELRTRVEGIVRKAVQSGQ